MEILKTPAKQLNVLTYNDYYTRLSILATSIFKWNDLPDFIPERFIEKVLFNQGLCAYYYDEEKGFYRVSRCTPSGKLNCYDDPVEYTCYSVEGSKTFKADDICIIRNNGFNVPTSHTIRLFAYRLAEVERTTDVNIKGQKTPIIIAVDEKQRLTFQNIINQQQDNEFAIYGTKAINLDDVKVFKTEVPFISDQLMIYKHDLWNDCMSFLGIANANTDKKERLVTDEVNANNQLVMLSASAMLKQREQACKEINAKFGTKISVEMRALEDLASVVAPAQEGNVDSGFNYSYAYYGKERRSEE